jgi:hypothetical protein
MLVANRLLPDGLPHRGDWERNVFWGAWLLSLLHAGWRSAPVRAARISPAWREQCWTVAALAVAAVVLNAVPTGDHLLKTVGEGYWPVACLDLALLSSAALAMLAARKLRRREQHDSLPAPRRREGGASSASLSASHRASPAEQDGVTSRGSHA